MAGHGVVRRGFVEVYQEIPVITRTYTMAALILTLATNFEFISQFQLYLNPDLILQRHQYWRIITPFLYAGPASFGTFFHLLFGYRYSRIMEEGYYYRRSSDYFFMYLFMATVILVVSLLCTNMVFLGHSLTHAILYLWCRRNPSTRVLVFGLLTVRANWIPYLLIFLNLVTGSPMTADVVAMTAGHAYYFLEDVFPKQRVGFRILKTPRFLKLMFDELPGSRGDSSGQERVDVVEENNELINDNAGGGGMQ